MNADWAAQNLQTIRTLMERSAVYRRALAPIMLTVGCIGLGAAVIGLKLEIAHPSHFILYWVAVGFLSSAVALILIRKQAITAKEPVWSPPARRILEAISPTLLTGLVIGLIVMLGTHAKGKQFPGLEPILAMVWLPQFWIIMYGCSLHAAGNTMPRGIRLFGWLFILAGLGMFIGGTSALPPSWYGHGIMGFFFGLLHQAYGVYLYLTEKKETSA